LIFESIWTNLFAFNVISLGLHPGGNAVIETIENWSLDPIPEPRFPVLTFCPVQPWNVVDCMIIKDIRIAPIVAEHINKPSQEAPLGISLQENHVSKFQLNDGIDDWRRMNVAQFKDNPSWTRCER